MGLLEPPTCDVEDSEYEYQNFVSSHAAPRDGPVGVQTELDVAPSLQVLVTMGGGEALAYRQSIEDPIDEAR